MRCPSLMQIDASVVRYHKSAKRRHQAIKGSRYVEIKDGPHGIIWTHSGEVNRELLAFSRDEKLVGAHR